jgi:hypothetical protein
VPRAKPTDPTGSGSPLDYLAIRYIYAESPTMFEVGRPDGRDGWISRASALEWDTRLMARPTPKAGRPSLVIYEQRGCLESKLSGRKCPQHEGACPTVGEESSGASEADSAVLGWPVLGSKPFKGTGGVATHLLEVAPLVNDKAPPPSEPPADLKPALRTVYIAFVVDTTASMQSTIDSVKELARTLTAEAGKTYGDVTLRLGLVAYRDRSPAFGYVAKRFSTFADPASFARALDSLEAAKKGDGSVDEAVLDGLTLALPDGTGHLDWPTGRDAELATKLVVLLGDAPDHATDLDRARQLAAMANREQITIATVSLKSATPLSRNERSRYVSQWRTLAESSFLPADSRQAFAKPIAPLQLAFDQAGGLTASLVALIDARVERARSLAAIAAAEAEGRLTEYVNSQGLTPSQVAPVLIDLHKGEARPVSRPDLQSGGKKAPTLRRGWIAQRQGGSDLVTLQMLLSLDELDVLISELTSLQQAARGDATELSNLLEVGNAAASGETSFLAKDRGRQTFAEHLRRREGVAPARPDSLLLRTQTDLLRAEGLDRVALDRRLGESLQRLIRRRNDPDWTQRGGTVEGKALVPFAWIDF